MAVRRSSAVCPAAMQALEELEEERRLEKVGQIVEMI